jgi:trk system potassium uptake protein TrkA
MKRFVIVGLGNFGSSVAETLHAQGYDVVAVDTDERAVDRVAPHVTRAAVGDGRQAETLRRLGAEGADAGVVSTGGDITASLLATLALRDLGVQHVYAKVVSHDHARVMERMGVKEVVFPEREAALNLGKRLGAQTVFNYVSIGAGFSMQEMAVPPSWQGQTLRELDLPREHRVSVIAVHDVHHDQMYVPPSPDAPLRPSDTLLVAGHDDQLSRLAKQH